MGYVLDYVFVSNRSNVRLLSRGNSSIDVQRLLIKSSLLP